MANSPTVFLLLFGRLLGFFVLSPLFSAKMLPKSIRFGLALACSLLLAPPLVAKTSFTLEQPTIFVLLIIKEIAIGYLIGFVFSLIFEAAAFAGQLVGVMMGFSATELIDPLATAQHPMLARFFSLALFTLFLATDLHHPLLRLLHGSVEIIPFSTETVQGILKAFSLFFEFALSLAFFPFLILLMLIGCFALLSRFFPIFWVGFPLQLLVGFAALGALFSYFFPLLETSFSQFWELSKKFIVHF